MNDTKESCQKRKTIKYKKRSSPPYSAADNGCKGTTRKGNDGKDYVSKPDKRGIYKWLPKGTIKKGKRSWTTMNNGAEPFVIQDFGSKISVYDNIYDKESDKYAVMSEKHVDIPYRELFVGDNNQHLKQYAKKGQYPGNSILLKTNKPGKYILIDSHIREITTVDNEEIREFCSPIGNSHVRYHYALGEKNTYFFLYDRYVPSEFIDYKKSKDPYEHYYGFGDFADEKIEKKSKKFHVKIIKKSKE